MEPGKKQFLPLTHRGRDRYSIWGLKYLARVRGVQEPEEGKQLASAHVKKEMLPHGSRQIQSTNQRHTEDIRVKVDRGPHILADHGHVIHAVQFKLGINTFIGLCCHLTPFNVEVFTLSWGKLYFTAATTRQKTG
jgi:hypothetical protein